MKYVGVSSRILVSVGRWLETCYFIYVCDGEHVHACTMSCRNLGLVEGSTLELDLCLQLSHYWIISGMCVCVSVCLSSVYLSVRLSVFLSVRLSVYLCDKDSRHYTELEHVCIDISIIPCSLAISVRWYSSKACIWSGWRNTKTYPTSMSHA